MEESNFRIRFFQGAILLGLLFYFSVLAYKYSSTGGDYFPDYLSAKLFFSGKQIYESENLSNLSRQIPEVNNMISNAGHPPVYVLFFSPLALLPFSFAFMLMGLLNALCTMLAGYFAAKIAKFDQNKTWLCMASSFFLLNAYAASANGNPTGLFSFCVVLGLYFSEKKWDWLAGFVIALVTLLKLYPGFLFFAFLFYKKRKAVLSFLITFGAANLVSLWVLGFEQNLRYFFHELWRNGSLFIGHGFNLSLHGAIHRTLGAPCEYSLWINRVVIMPELAHMMSQSIFLIGIPGILLFFYLQRRRYSFEGVYSILVVAMCLINPLTWSGMLGVCFASLAVWFKTCCNTGRKKVLMALVTFSLFFPVDYIAKYAHSFLKIALPYHWSWLFILLLPTISLACLLICLIGDLKLFPPCRNQPRHD